MDYIATHKPAKITRRDEILGYIAEYATDHHNAPSTYEIARAFEIGQKTVYNHLMRLIVEGRLIQTDGKWKIPQAEYIPPPIG